MESCLVIEMERSWSDSRDILGGRTDCPWQRIEHGRKRKSGTTLQFLAQVIGSGSIEIAGLGLERGDDKCSLDIIPDPVTYTPQDLLIPTCPTPQTLVSRPMGIVQLQPLVPRCLIPNQAGLGAFLFSYLNCFSCRHSKDTGSLCGRQGVDLSSRTTSSCHLWLILCHPCPAACPAGSQVRNSLQFLVYQELLQLPHLAPLCLHQ